MNSASIGIRQAKANLSRLVAEVQRGTEWTITDRGRPVARLTQLRRTDTPVDPLLRLEELGWVMPQLETTPRIPRPLELHGVDLQRMLQDDRDG